MVRGTNKEGVDSVYSFNGLGALVNNTATTSRDFVLDYTAFVPRELTEVRDNQVALKYAYAAGNRISADVTANTGKTKLNYHNDRLGSAVYLTDAQGILQASANYDEWGNRTNILPMDIGGKQTDMANSYTGHEWDSSLGVYYAKARLYAPATKRFLAEDMLKGKMLGASANEYTVDGIMYLLKCSGEYTALETKKYYNPTTGLLASEQTPRDGSNWYSYCDNNPIAFVDPSGLEIRIIPRAFLGNRDQYVDATLAHLQSLTDHTLTIDRRSGRVSILTFASENTYPSGNELIERMINSGFTTTIRVSPGNMHNSHQATSLSNSSNGIGSDSSITFDPGYQVPVLTHVPGTSNLVEPVLEVRPTPVHIILVHELIHADRSMRGVRINDTEKTGEHSFLVLVQESLVKAGEEADSWLFPGAWPLRVVRRNENASQEELAAIGLKYYGEGDITENMIRMEQDEPQRGAYRTYR